MSEYPGCDLQHLAAEAGCRAEEIIDFSTTLNPLGPPFAVAATIIRSAFEATAFPGRATSFLSSAMATHYKCPRTQIVPGRGATELIFSIPLAVGARRALIVAPCHADYATACERAGIPTAVFLLKEENGFRLRPRELEELGTEVREGDLVFIGRPSDPAGTTASTLDIEGLCARRRGATFVVDESFIDFTDEPSLLQNPLADNCIVVRSLTGFYGIAGMRLGAAFAQEALAEKLRLRVLPRAIDTLSARVGIQVLEAVEFARSTRDTVHLLRSSLLRDLGEIPHLVSYPSESNSILVRAEQPVDARQLMESVLRNHRIALGPCDQIIGLSDAYFRIGVRVERDNQLLIQALKAEMDGTRPPVKRGRPRPKRLMFQGTCSNAGKSVLTAALCRILQRKGVRVAPFKAQNMSLNSYVSQSGGEMGRAQALQAQACRIAPDCRMNPILLKPNSDNGSQIIMNGRPVGNMSTVDYRAYKETASANVKAAFDALSADFEAIVLEGAGSPAEINLKEHDIVNMGMARYAQCPVLIAGDIDRGGVFASFVGTFALLDKAEQDLTKGFVINRFRGDASQLSSALDATQMYTGKPTLGVVPFIENLGLPEEDSVSFKDRKPGSNEEPRDLDVAFIDLPHLSNFTDADPLEGEPDVRLRVVGRAEDLGQPDAVIIPGSKNTGFDLEQLQRSGLADAIRHLAVTSATEVVGICGGFQMLGNRIEDHGVECPGQRDIAGLGLLPLTTTMKEKKTLTRRGAIHLESGLEIQGYEIHHGETSADGLRPLLRIDDGRVAGAKSADGHIWGTYLHGIFDADVFRRWWLDRLRKQKGLKPLRRIQFAYDVDVALDRLGDVVEDSVDIQAIFRLMGL